MADIVLYHLSFLEPPYAAYCQQNEHVGRAINSLCRSEPAFAAMVETCKHRMHNLDLNAYRLKPLQRVTRCAC